MKYFAQEQRDKFIYKRVSLPLILNTMQILLHYNIGSDRNICEAVVRASTDKINSFVPDVNSSKSKQLAELEALNQVTVIRHKYDKRQFSLPLK